LNSTRFQRCCQVIPPMKQSDLRQKHHRGDFLSRSTDSSFLLRNIQHVSRAVLTERYKHKRNEAVGRVGTTTVTRPPIQLSIIHLSIKTQLWIAEYTLLPRKHSSSRYITLPETGTRFPIAGFTWDKLLHYPFRLLGPLSGSQKDHL
jgi:hypothetical protein